MEQREAGGVVWVCERQTDQEGEWDDDVSEWEEADGAGRGLVRGEDPDCGADPVEQAEEVDEEAGEVAGEEETTTGTGGSGWIY